MKIKEIIVIGVFGAMCAVVSSSFAAIWYVDAVNGSNSNSGTEWATALANTTAITATMLSAGDEIRIAKTPSPIFFCNATATYGDKNLTLAQNVTANIDMAETVWTAATSVTATRSTNAREGTYSASFSIASGFTTGKVAYYTLPSALDLSAYQKINAWIATSPATAANVYYIALCSDTTGDVPVNTDYVSYVTPGSSSVWKPAVADTGSALGSSIQSVALYAASDPGTATVLVDDIFVSPRDGITLNSVFSDTSADAFDFGHVWHTVGTVNGTLMTVDSGPSALASTSSNICAWLGATGSVSLYHREGINMWAGTAWGPSVKVSEGGSSATLTNRVSGGWNVAENAQDGMTWFFDNGVANNYVFDGTTGLPVYTAVSEFGFSRCYVFETGTGGASLRNISFSAGRTATSLDYIDSTLPIILDNIHVSQTNLAANIATLSGAASQGAVFGKNILAQGATYDLRDKRAGTGANIVSRIENFVALNKMTGDISYLGSSTNMAGFVTDYGSYSASGIVRRSPDWAHSGTTSWKFTPTALAVGVYTLRYPLSQAFVTAGHQVTVTGWVNKTDATGSVARLVVGGCGSTKYATATDVTGQQKLTLTFMPEKSGVIEISGCVQYALSTAQTYFDDISVSVEGNPRYDTSDLTYSYAAYPYNPNAQGLSYATAGSN